ncbi:sulfonate transport system permease protein [Variovorax boronicumulans]|uniref:Sulfonate transport system permease protein n=1 Tax=Variovorax boronicumulans TaxID=436515 RepID=A0AAW8D007_9BURK|nr:ABC transporter permease [Variovorax boronicumulans]MDP9894482.1 sulfonate transport system permease protein [Variovorax boronicumulans]MDQ0054301.1 sulfonate transport system permease protein [Variovorax boronicumulans]
MSEHIAPTSPAVQARRAHPVPKALRGWVVPLLLLALWWTAARLGWGNAAFLVSPEAVWQRAVSYTASGELWEALGSSLWRDLAGFAIGVTAGLVGGGLLGLSRLAERALGPSFHTLKQISLFAWIPLISVWFGLGDAAKVAFLSLAAFFPVVLNTHEGIRSVPRELIEVARALKFSRWQMLTRVVLPSASPSIFAGIHLALIYAWLATLGAEYLLVSGKGIGNTMIDGREHFHMDLVIFGVVVVGLTGFTLNWIATRIETRLLAWRGRLVAQF